MTAENREKEIRQFNRALCIRDSITGYTPTTFSSMAWNFMFEEKYLGDEVKEEPVEETNGRFHTRFYRIPTIEPVISKFALELSNRASTLGNPELNSISNSQESQLRKLGTTIRTQALNHGLVREQNIDDIKDRLTNPDSLYLDPLGSDLDTRGWQIFEAKEGDDYIIVFKPQDESENLACIDLDDLYARDPEFVKQAIRTFHEIDLKNKLVNTIIYNLAIHDANLGTNIPDILKALVETQDMEEERLNLLAFIGAANFINRGTGVGYDPVGKYMEAVMRISQTVPVVDGKARYIALISYLLHIASCPAEAEDLRSETSVLKGAYAQIETIYARGNSWDKYGYPGEAQGENWAADQEILQHTDRYANGRINYVKSRVEQRLSEDKKFAGFLDQLTASTTQEEALQLLGVELPDLYQTLLKFREFMGNDYDGQSKLQKIINEVTRVLQIRGTQVTLYNDVDPLVKEQINIKAPYIQNNPWIVRSFGSEVYIKDEQLQDAVEVLTCLTIPSVIEQFKDKYRQKIVGSNRELADLEQKRIQMAAFLDRTKIPQETVEKLAEYFRMEDDVAGPRYWIGLNVMFNIIYLRQLGLINPQSRVLRTFVSGVYPHIKDAAWDILTGNQ